jgi:hypothetical protein
MNQNIILCLTFRLKNKFLLKNFKIIIQVVVVLIFSTLLM